MKRKFTSSFFRISFQGIVILILTVFSYGCCKSKQHVREEVDHIATLPHGFSRLSPEDQKLLERIKANPEQYLPAIKDNLSLNRDLREVTKSENSLKAHGSIALLFFIDNKESVQIAMSLEDTLLNYLEDEWQVYRDFAAGKRKTIPPVTQELVSLNSSILQGLKATGNKAGIENAIHVITLADYSSALIALQYLAEVAAGNQDVAGRVSEAVGAKTSSFYKDPLANRYIVILQKGKPHGK